MANDNFNMIVVGKRQTIRQLALGNISRIILATDADKHYKQSVYHAGDTYGVKVVERGDKATIASSYNVEVPSAVVGVLINPLNN